MSYLGDVIALDASGATDRISRAVDSNGPRFEDAAHGNFALKRSSPLIDAGVRSGWMDTACDIAGIKRCLKRGLLADGALPDVGCYEFITTPGFKISLR